MSVKKSKYKEALEKIGLKQLDIYRYKNRDVVRVVRKSDGKVYVVDLSKHIEDMNPEEFAEYVENKLS